MSDRKQLLRQTSGTRRSPLTARQVRCALLAGVTCIIGHQALAQQFNNSGAPLRLRSEYLGYSLSISPTVSYTDNINLLPEPVELPGGAFTPEPEGSVIAGTTFGGAGIFSNRLFTGLINGDLNLSYIEQGDDFVVNQDIGGVGVFTLVDNLFYLDFAGSTGRQLIGDNARFSANINAGRNQRANVHNFAVSPYFYRKFADESEAQLRYRFSQVFIDEDQGSAAQGFFNDSQAQEVQATWRSGDKFERLTVGLTAYGNRTVEDGSDVTGVPRLEYEQGTLQGDLEYALSDRFALTGTIGYDDVSTDVPTAFLPTEELSGVFWSAGFRLRQGRKTDIRLEYGERFGDDFINGSVSYDISRRFQFRAEAARRFQTRSQQVSTRINSAGIQTLEFFDSLQDSGQTRSPAGLVQSALLQRRGLNAQNIGLGVSNDVSATITGLFSRSSLAATVSYSDTDFGFRESEVLGGQLAYQHQFSRRLSAYADVFFRGANESINLQSCLDNPELVIGPGVPGADPVAACQAFVLQGADSDTLGGRIGARYLIYRNVSAFAEYSHTERFSPQPLFEFDENTISAGLTLTF